VIGGAGFDEMAEFPVCRKEDLFAQDGRHEHDARITELRSLVDNQMQVCQQDRTYNLQTRKQNRFYERAANKSA
jgi:hypothetical protein